MHIPRLYTAATAAVGLAAATLIAAPAATAHQGTDHHGHHHPPGLSQKVLASGLLSPLRAAVSDHGTVYVSENFAGKIDRVTPDGHRTTIYTDPGHNEVGGLSLAGHFLYFTVTQSSGSEGAPSTGSWLKVLTPNGKVRTIADVHAFEAANNPDKINTYGIVNASALDPTCAAKWPSSNGPISYTGVVDSHPYSTTPGAHGSVYIADAAANAVFQVWPGGRIRTVSVLPPIPFKITADAAKALGVDPCFVGQTYNFEPVPTDIEMARTGTLFVTSLPGGPPGPQLGGRGSIFAINPFFGHHGHGHHGHGHHGHGHHGHGHHGYGHHGHHGYGHHGSLAQAHRVVGGLVNPTGLAITPRGDIFVAQLFGNVISRVTWSGHGANVTDVISTTNPGEVEWGPTGLYYTANVLSGTPEDPSGSKTPAGKLVRVGPGYSHH
jgi:streptogramin lyase